MNQQDIQEIQILLSTKVLKGITDPTIQNIVRGIIFDTRNTINWDNALERIHVNMPELTME